MHGDFIGVQVHRVITKAARCGTVLLNSQRRCGQRPRTLCENLHWRNSDATRLTGPSRPLLDQFMALRSIYRVRGAYFLRNLLSRSIRTIIVRLDETKRTGCETSISKGNEA